jgi:hypothetical protein
VPAVPVRANRHCVDGGRKRTSSQHHALGVHVSPQDASHVFRTLSMYLLFRPPIPYGFASSDLATRSMQPQTGGKNERMQESKRTTLRVFDQKMLHVHANGVLTKKAKTPQRSRERSTNSGELPLPMNKIFFSAGVLVWRHERLISRRNKKCMVMKILIRYQTH